MSDGEKIQDSMARFMINIEQSTSITFEQKAQLVSQLRRIEEEAKGIFPNFEESILCEIDHDNMQIIHSSAVSQETAQPSLPSLLPLPPAGQMHQQQPSSQHQSNTSLPLQKSGQSTEAQQAQPPQQLTEQQQQQKQQRDIIHFKMMLEIFERSLNTLSGDPELPLLKDKYREMRNRRTIPDLTDAQKMKVFNKKQFFNHYLKVFEKNITLVKDPARKDRLEKFMQSFLKHLNDDPLYFRVYLNDLEDFDRRVLTNEDPTCVKEHQQILEFLRRFQFPVATILERLTSPQNFLGLDGFFAALKEKKLEGLLDFLYFRQNNNNQLNSIIHQELINYFKDFGQGPDGQQRFNNAMQVFREKLSQLKFREHLLYNDLMTTDSKDLDKQLIEKIIKYPNFIKIINSLNSIGAEMNQIAIAACISNGMAPPQSVQSPSQPPQSTLSTQQQGKPAPLLSQSQPQPIPSNIINQQQKQLQPAAQQPTGNVNQMNPTIQPNGQGSQQALMQSGAIQSTAQNSLLYQQIQQQFPPSLPNQPFITATPSAARQQPQLANRGGIYPRGAAGPYEAGPTGQLTAVSSQNQQPIAQQQPSEREQALSRAPAPAPSKAVIVKQETGLEDPKRHGNQPTANQMRSSMTQGVQGGQVQGSAQGGSQTSSMMGQSSLQQQSGMIVPSGGSGVGQMQKMKVRPVLNEENLMRKLRYFSNESSVELSEEDIQSIVTYLHNVFKIYMKNLLEKLLQSGIVENVDNEFRLFCSDKLDPQLLPFRAHNIDKYLLNRQDLSGTRDMSFLKYYIVQSDNKNIRRSYLEKLDEDIELACIEGIEKSTLFDRSVIHYDLDRTQRKGDSAAEEVKQNLLKNLPPSKPKQLKKDGKGESMASNSISLATTNCSRLKITLKNLQLFLESNPIYRKSFILLKTYLS